MSFVSLDSSHHYSAHKINEAFVLPKNLIFNPFQPKNTSLTPLKQLQTNSSTQNTQKRFRNLKSNLLVLVSLA
jgi:hypothetical protein